MRFIHFFRNMYILIFYTPKDNLREERLQYNFKQNIRVYYKQYKRILITIYNEARQFESAVKRKAVNLP